MHPLDSIRVQKSAQVCDQNCNNVFGTIMIVSHTCGEVSALDNKITRIVCKMLCVGSFSKSLHVTMLIGIVEDVKVDSEDTGAGA